MELVPKNMVNDSRFRKVFGNDTGGINKRAGMDILNMMEMAKIVRSVDGSLNNQDHP